MRHSCVARCCHTGCHGTCSRSAEACCTMAAACPNGRPAEKGRKAFVSVAGCDSPKATCYAAVIHGDLKSLNCWSSAILQYHYAAVSHM